MDDTTNSAVNRWATEKSMGGSFAENIVDVEKDTTEKIFEPMISGCVPIYWGNPFIKEDFNSSSFINAKDYTNEDLLEIIIELDHNEKLYNDYLMAPYILNNHLFNINNLIEIFKKIV